MVSYNFNELEQKWQKAWKDQSLYEVSMDPSKPKYYVLDMFPYPSGAGLHVGHPLGYIASDIVSRFKHLNGYNVLHPMGFDAFGLPAEQYAIQTGQHPAITTAKNIERYKTQLNRLGFAFDWSREVQTCDPGYYKWTQWIFSELFQSWYNKKSNKAESINRLISIFEVEGNVNISHHGDNCQKFTAEDWEHFTAKEKEARLQCYRLAYRKETTVNWCQELGTVLANEEVKDGKSERGGYPVVQKKMTQWYLRISAYADRLLEGLEKINWSDSLKEMQKNWIGKSEGASIHFRIKGQTDNIEIFTTRPDTIYGATFMVLSPEHPLANKISTADRSAEVQAYQETAKAKTERDRIVNKDVSGCFTGAYAINPFTEKEIPVYIADYVLSAYGSGAIMAVPGHDERDHAFAVKYQLPVIQVVDSGAAVNILEASYDGKEGKLINSGMINGLDVKNAMRAIIQQIELKGIGKRQTNYKLRDAGFSRQRYWGEPFPIVFRDEIPHLVTDLPVSLPEVESYKPTGTGESPLAAVETWVNTAEGRRETDTMPGWAGSSWYFLRYTDPHNEETFAAADKLEYWNQVDLYIGGTEHATGHLLYSRFWTKFLYDIGKIGFDEPFKKLVNQGMIQGQSRVLYKLDYVFSNWGDQDPNLDKGNIRTFLLSSELADRLQNSSSQNPFRLQLNRIIRKEEEKIKRENPMLKGSMMAMDPSILSEKQYIRIPLQYIDKSDKVDFVRFLNDNQYGLDNNTVILVLDENDDIQSFSSTDTQVYKTYSQYFKADTVVEKMSKRWGNVVNPDDVCEEFGADTLRLYEMFLGPLEDSKPWSTKGIDGTHRFLKKLWNLFFDKEGNLNLTDDKPSSDALKSLHKTIKKVTEDIENYSFNTSVSQFMICVNELQSCQCTSRDILEKLLIVLSPFAPHITEELWQAAGHTDSIYHASWPSYDPSLLVEKVKNYPISINGKTRTQIDFPMNASKEAIEREVLNNEVVIKWLEGKAPKKVIVIPGRIVNIVV